MRPRKIEPGSSKKVEVRYFRPVDSLCRRGILALEFYNFVARPRACLTSLTPSHCSQRKAGGSSDHIRNGFARNSFRLRWTTCTDGGAHPPEAELQGCHDPLPFSLYRPRIGRVLPQSIVDPIRMIQVISTTPILGSVEKSAIRGIRGTAVKCGCIPRS